MSFSLTQVDIRQFHIILRELLCVDEMVLHRGEQVTPVKYLTIHQ